MAIAIPNAIRSDDAMVAVRTAACVGAVIFAACLAGILSRPLGFLAAIWPANALLLGIMLRFPYLATRSGWTGATLGYLAADLITGGGLVLTLWLTASNLAGVLTAYTLFHRASDEDRHLRRPPSVLFMFAACALGAATSAAVGAGSAPVYFGKSLSIGLSFWFTTELVNYIVIVPTLLTAPPLRALWGSRRQIDVGQAMSLKESAPVLALALSIAASLIIGGPGAIAFPVPALLWCALTYSLFVTSLLTTLVCVWLLVAISAALLPLPVPADVWQSAVSVRLGITLLALGPLTAASINTARNELLRQLDFAANHDTLTGILSRHALLARGRAALTSATADGMPSAVMVLDIDRFKSINDCCGHAAGDRALIAFSGIVAGEIREDDVFGRFGGEEFVLILPRASAENALAIAERIRAAVERATVTAGAATPVSLSVSIGVAHCSPEAEARLEVLLSKADEALYRAKRGGRNRVMAATQGQPLRQGV